MTKARTVLILGAGASYPYMLPSGEDLRSALLDKVPRPLLELLRQADFSDNEIDHFRSQFKASGQRSIDRFLQFRDEFSNIAKFMTAYHILSLENPRHDTIREKCQNWYEYLWGEMSEAGESLTDNWLRVITFNYDRSLEDYLTRAYRATFGCAYNVARNRLKDCLPILHMYGQVGEFPATDSVTGPGELQFGAPATLKNVQNAAAQIKTIHERDVAELRDQQINSFMHWAERVAFLGFSFDKANVKRLQLHVLRKANPGRLRGNVPVFGTRIGLQDGDLDSAKIALECVQQPPVFESCDSEILLRKFSILH